MDTGYQTPGSTPQKPPRYSLSRPSSTPIAARATLSSSRFKRPPKLNSAVGTTTSASSTPQVRSGGRRIFPTPPRTTTASTITAPNSVPTPAAKETILGHKSTADSSSSHVATDPNASIDSNKEAATENRLNEIPKASESSKQPQQDSAGWQKVVDPTSGNTYYYNAQTGETSWELPSSESIGQETSVSDSKKKNSLVDDGWETMEDPTSGKTYFYHRQSGETSWELPTSKNSAVVNEEKTTSLVNDTSNVVATSESHDSDINRLPEGWEKLTDQASGEVYYHNEKTGESSWEPPVRPVKEEDPKTQQSVQYEEPSHEEMANLPVGRNEHSGVSPREQQGESTAEETDEPLLVPSNDQGTGTEPNNGAKDTDSTHNDAAMDSARNSSPPDGWVEVTDPASGNSYYDKEGTGETSWEPPARTESDEDKVLETEGGQNELETDGIGSSLKAAERLPIGWEEMIDPTSGDTYYYNEQTGESSWEPPAGAGGGENLAEATTAAEGSPQIQADVSEAGEDQIVVETDVGEGSQSPPNTAKDSEKESKLPLGWEEMIDPSSGDTYYYNEQTGESSWEPPAGAGGGENLAEATTAAEGSPQVQADVSEAGEDQIVVETDVGEGSQSPPNTTKDSEKESKLPLGWEEMIDPSSGDTYYYNEQTGESTWEPPAVAGGDENLAEATTAAEGSPQIQASVSEAGEDQIVVETDVGEGSQSPPNTAKDSEKESKLPLGWEEMIDPSSGDTYYYNEQTGESTWEPPAGAGGDENLAEATTAAEGSPQIQASVSEAGEDQIVVETDVGEGSQSPPNTAKDSEKESKLPLGWEEMIDPSSGDTYYYNEQTGESSWEPPAGAGGGENLAEATTAAEGSPQVQADVSEAGEDQIVVEKDVGEGSNSPPNTAKDSEKESKLPFGWEEMIDPSSGDTYYYNEQTGESSWEPPMMPSADADGTESESPFVDQASKPDDLTEPIELLQETSMIPDDLPDGWEEVVDTSSGDLYYYNEQTGESSWERPMRSEKDSSPLVSQNEPGENHSKVIGVDVRNDREVDGDTARRLPRGWEMMTDPATSDVYYYNESTGETSWERPLPPESSGPEEEESTGEEIGSTGEPTATYLSQKPEIECAADDGDVYYFNESTGESSWDPPETTDTKPLRSLEPERLADTVLVQSQPEDSAGDRLLDRDDPSSEIAASSVSVPDVPSGWQKVEDPTTGDAYYFNEASGESSWEIPNVDTTGSPLGEETNGQTVESKETSPRVQGTSAPTENTSPTSTVLPSGWALMEDPTTGDTYYYNEATGESSWEAPFAPEDERPSDTHNESPSVSERLEEDAVVSIDWNQIKDPTSGDIYYYNASTGETAWELPSENESKKNEKEEDTERIEETDSADHQGSGLVGGRDPPGENQEAARENFHTSQGEQKLSAGWEEVIDEHSGDVYYFNESTGETSWEAPSRSNVSTKNSSAGSPVELPEGWAEVTDPSSGDIYFYNESSGESSWTHPGTTLPPEETQNELESKPEVTNIPKLNTAPSSIDDRRSPHAIATFGFGGRLCMLRPKRAGATIEVHATCRVAPIDPVIQIENSKKRKGVTGPLEVEKEKEVLAYISFICTLKRDILWDFVSIATKSRGRLRCDSVHSSSKPPEGEIINVLLGSDEKTNGMGSPSRSLRKPHDEEDLAAVQGFLLKGDREKAVEAALHGGHFAMALLVASMCSRETYSSAAKAYADAVLVRGSPLHTTAMLFCGQLQAPEGNGFVDALWDGDSDSLRKKWKHHLAAIISNRTVGWDQIVVSLGDRLKELGEVSAAHVCYMVCGCSVSSPANENSKLTLIGCDVTPGDIMMMSNDAIEAFARTEAFEWAKRQGNRNARILSLQAFKLRYAMLLVDWGLKDIAMKYLESVLCSVGEVPADALDPELPLFVAIISLNLPGILHYAQDFKHRLIGGSCDTSDYWVKPAREGETDLDATFVTAYSSPDDPPKRIAVKPPSFVISAPQKTSSIPAPTPISPDPDYASASPRSLNLKKPLVVATVPPGEPSAVKPNSVSQVVPTAAVEGQPPVFIPSSSAPASTTDGSGISSAATKPMDKDSVRNTTPKHASNPRAPSTAAPSSTTPLSTDKPKTAPVSAPANLQSSTPSSAKKGGGFFGLKSTLTKLLNPNATEADIGEKMEAYYDKERKVWVFPGEDPAEVAKPPPPPPTSIPAASPAEPAPPQVDDPLAAMMAPPPVRGLRRTIPANTSRSMPAAPPTPQFAVFQPAPQATKKEDTGDSKETKEE